MVLGQLVSIFLLHGFRGIYYYCYYSHIFPDSRAQHCNYATLLAGRCGNNLWYSVIFPVGPSLLSILVFSVSSVGDVSIFSGFYLATCSVLCLSLSLPRWAYLYRFEVFCNGVSLCPMLWTPYFTSINLGGVYCVKDLLLLHISTPLPVHRMRMHSDPYRRGILSVHYTYMVFLPRPRDFVCLLYV